MKNLENVTLMDYNEFDELVKKYFPLSNYDSVAENEWSNEECHLILIDPLTERDLLPDSYYNMYEKPDMENFVIGDDTDSTISACNILNYLVNEKHVLCHGYYLIEVSW